MTWRSSLDLFFNKISRSDISFHTSIIERVWLFWITILFQICTQLKETQNLWILFVEVQPHACGSTLVLASTVDRTAHMTANLLRWIPAFFKAEWYIWLSLCVSCINTLYSYHSLRLLHKHTVFLSRSLTLRSARTVYPNGYVNLEGSVHGNRNS